MRRTILRLHCLSVAEKEYGMESLYIILPVVTAVLVGSAAVIKVRKTNLKDKNMQDDFERTADMQENSVTKDIQKVSFKMIQDIVIVHTDEKI